MHFAQEVARLRRQQEEADRSTSLLRNIVDVIQDRQRQRFISGLKLLQLQLRMRPPAPEGISQDV